MKVRGERKEEEEGRVPNNKENKKSTKIHENFKLSSQL